MIESGPLALFQSDAQDLGPRRRQVLVPGGLVQERAKTRSLDRLHRTDGIGQLLGCEGKGVIDTAERSAVE